MTNSKKLETLSSHFSQSRQPGQKTCSVQQCVVCVVCFSRNQLLLRGRQRSIKPDLWQGTNHLMSVTDRSLTPMRCSQFMENDSVASTETRDSLFCFFCLICFFFYYYYFFNLPSLSTATRMRPKKQNV